MERPRRWCVCGDPDCADAHYPKARADKVDAYMDHVEAERDTLQAQLIEANRLPEAFLDADSVEGAVLLEREVRAYLNSPPEALLANGDGINVSEARASLRRVLKQLDQDRETREVK